MILHAPVVGCGSIHQFEAVVIDRDVGLHFIRRPIGVAAGCRPILFKVGLLYLCVGVNLKFSVGNQAVEVFIVLLRVPCQRVSVDGDSALLGVGNKLFHGREVHASVVLYARRIFHCVSGSHLHEVATGQTINQLALVEVGSPQGNTQLEVGIALAG